MWERIGILAAFVGFVCLARWVTRQVATLQPKEAYDAPSSVVPIDHRPRPRLTALRAPATRDDVRAVRMDKRGLGSQVVR